MKSDENTINLEIYRIKGAKVLTGRSFGKHVREDSRIDEIENNFEEVNVTIPDDIYSIAPSFLEEFFVNVIRKLGKEKFLVKFKFNNKGEYDYETALHEAIERVLRKKTALD